MGIDIRNVHMATLEQSNLLDITEMWNRCWRGYYYDMSYSHELMKLWLELSQVSLGHSTAILVNHQVVGFSLLSIDGSDGWIAGACIDPDYRRNGLFTVLMRTQLNLANSINLNRVYLEVLEHNHARIVYQSVGFNCLRQLNVYRSPSKLNLTNLELMIHPVLSIPLDNYFEKRRRACFIPSWQRREGYLRRYNNLMAVTNQTETAGALLAGENWSLLLDIWSVDSAGAKEVLSTILQRLGGPLSLTNQPNDWIFTFLEDYGIKPSTKQIEMCIELS